MSVENITPIQHYIANGETTAFTFDFKVEGKTNIIVYANDEVIHPNKYNYETSTNSVNFNEAPVANTKITIKRFTDLVRKIQYETFNNTFRPETLNADIDRVWMALQEQDVVYDQKVDKATRINLGEGLIGGGDLSADVEISLKDQSITSQYYGDSLSVPVIKVNNYGVIEEISTAPLVGIDGNAITVNWDDLLNYPTTITGYGITDAINQNEKGAANGVATLNAASLIPLTQLPDAKLVDKGVVQLNNTLTSPSISQALTAAQGKELQDTKLNTSDFIATLKTNLNVVYYDSAPMFTCRAWANFNAVPLTGTYTQSGTTITVTMTNYDMALGQLVNLAFTSGTAVSGHYTVASRPGSSVFTVTAATSATTSGNVTRNLYIRKSGNVSSITDNGVGDYTINFTTLLMDSNYSFVGACKSEYTDQSFSGVLDLTGIKSVSSQRIRTKVNGTNAVAFDALDANIAVFR